jgi:hypothetical protein
VKNRPSSAQKRAFTSAIMASTSATSAPLAVVLQQVPDAEPVPRTRMAFDPVAFSIGTLFVPPRSRAATR